MRFETLEEIVLHAVADYMDAKPDELGPQWVAFASAVESVIISPTGMGRVDAIGKLAIAAVNLPE